MPRTSRQTKQKDLLAKTAASFTTFFSADDIYSKVNAKGIGMATIYRFLKQGVLSGMFHPYSCGKQTIYSLKRQSHCHFICERTGSVTHFTVDSLDFLKDKIPGKVSSFQIEIRGECDECDECP